MEKVLKGFCLAALIVQLTACDNRTVDTSQVKKEMERREIKRVMPGEIMSYAEEKAEKIMDSLQVELADASTPFDSTGSNVSNLETAKWADEQHKATILLYESIDEAQGEMEEDIYEAYEYNVENRLALDGSIHSSPNGDTYYYTSAFLDDNVLKMWSIRMPRKELVIEITAEE